jgi:hypothetical protein
VAGEHRGDLVAIGFARRGLAKIDQPLIEDRHLEPEIAQFATHLAIDSSLSKGGSSPRN